MKRPMGRFDRYGASACGDDNGGLRAFRAARRPAARSGDTTTVSSTDGISSVSIPPGNRKSSFHAGFGTLEVARPGLEPGTARFSDSCAQLSNAREILQGHGFRAPAQQLPSPQIACNCRQCWPRQATRVLSARLRRKTPARGRHRLVLIERELAGAAGDAEPRERGTHVWAGLLGYARRA